MSREALGQILRPLRKSQQTVIGLVVEAMAAIRQAASIPIALALAQKVGCQADCALTRVYRLLHNPRLDDLVISRQMIKALARRGASVLIALDWTEWHPPLRMLLASVVAGTRAVPVQTAVFRKTAIPRSQNCWENTFLQMLAMVLKEAGVVACFLADRGFRRVSFIQLLLRQTGHTFLVRLAEKVKVQTKRGGQTLRNWGLQPGRAVDLGWVDVRQDAAVRVRVVGIWAKGHREPWWLATNCPDSLSRLVSLYDRRMTIEEQIRDTKGARFGFALVWTQIKTPEALARFVLLIGLAVLLLTAVGHAVAERHPSIRIPSKTKGPRLSYLSIGLLLWPLLQPKLVITSRFLEDHLPPPALRSFAWLNRYGKRK
jgi:hypothetical protein